MAAPLNEGGGGFSPPVTPSAPVAFTKTPTVNGTFAETALTVFDAQDLTVASADGEVVDTPGGTFHRVRIELAPYAEGGIEWRVSGMASGQWMRTVQVGAARVGVWDGRVPPSTTLTYRYWDGSADVSVAFHLTLAG